MRVTVLALVGALGLITAVASAQAAPAVDAHGPANIVKVWGGCGPGFRPVPGHWAGWGVWVPPHCVPSRGPRAPYWGPYRRGPYYRWY